MLTYDHLKFRVRWGKRSPHWDMNNEVYAVCQRTGNTPMRNYFTSPGWFNIGAILNERGFSVAEIECILRSDLMEKITYPPTKKFGDYNSADFDRVWGEMTQDPQTFREAASHQMLDDLEELEQEETRSSKEVAQEFEERIPQRIDEVKQLKIEMRTARNETEEDDL